MQEAVKCLAEVVVFRTYKHTVSFHIRLRADKISQKKIDKECVTNATVSGFTLPQSVAYC